MAASSIDRFLGILFSNQILLIEVLFAIIIGLCILWLFFNLQSESTESESEKQLKDIEKVLEKVIAHAPKPTLQQASTAQTHSTGPAATTGSATTATPAGAAATAAAPAGNAAAQLELEKLKADNQLKTQKLSDLEKALNQAKEELTKAQAQPVSAQNTDELQKKIKDLEARLAEYEIIEDDIANLSLYKEENVKLKTELQKLKTNAGATNTADPVPEVQVQKQAPIPAQAPKPELSVKQAEPPIPEMQTTTPSAAPASQLQPTEAAHQPPVPEGMEAAKINQDKLVEEMSQIATSPTPETPKAAGDDKDSSEKLIAEFEGFMKDAEKT